MEARKYGGKQISFFYGAIGLCFCLAACGSNESNTTKTNPADWFRDVSRQADIRFIQDPGVDGSYFMPESLGSGAAFFDYNNDGRLDIYFVNAGPHNKTNTSVKDRLYRQRPGGGFDDVTDASGLGDTGYGTGVAAGDIDNDGFVDLYVANFGTDRLYHNNGDGTFSEITEKSGIRSAGWSSSVIFFDYDLDGFLDIYVIKYLQYNESVHCTDKAGRKEYCGPKAFVGSPDALYHNNRNGTFTDVSVESGIASSALKGLGVFSADFNADGYPDLYVADDGEPNHLWINQKNGSFRDDAALLGLAVNALGQSEASMGIGAGDADGDGDMDLFITDLREEKNTFYRNLGKAGFQDDSWPSGLAASSVPFTGFGAGMLDYDNDGDLDIAVANGRIARGVTLVHSQPASFWDPYSEPNLLFRNNGAGQFENVSARAGSFCSMIENSRGLAFGDYDNDGGIDMLITNTGAPARLYHNEVPNRGHWLGVRVMDPSLKRDALGAKVTAFVGSKQIVRLVAPGYSYLCSNDPRVHFGIGRARKIDRIVVEWPGGKPETFTDIQADRIITLRKGDGKSS